MIEIRCACGEVYFSEERHVGSRIRCRRCGAILEIGSVKSRGPSVFPVPREPGSPPIPPSTPPGPEIVPPPRRSRVPAAVVAFLVVVSVFVGIPVITLWVQRSSPRSEQYTARPAGPSLEAPPGTTRPAGSVDPFFPVQHEPDPQVVLDRVRRQLAASAPAHPTAPFGQDVSAGPVAGVCGEPSESGQPPRPRTGSEYGPAGSSGHGTLTVVNGDSRDAVVHLVAAENAPRPRRVAYVRGGETLVIRRITPGRYHLRFLHGRRWVAAQHMLYCEQSSSEFAEALDYPTEDSGGYAVFEVTLHPVVGGTARTRAIDPSLFVLPEQ